jgi:nucleotide-binding universal stress UspA family protein
MGEIGKILVGLDLKKSTKNLLEYAFDFAEHTGDSLILLHVVDYNEKHRVSDNPQKAIMANAKFLTEKSNYLKSIINSLTNKDRVDYSIITKTGYIHRQILEVSEENIVRLILLGINPEVNYFTFESTIDEVISLSEIPVLIVPENMKYCPFKNKLYSTDFMYEDSQSIHFMLALDGTLTCLHVDMNEEESEISRKRMDILKNIFKNGDIQYVICQGKVTPSILEYASQIKADLVGFTHKQKDLWNHFFHTSTCKSFIKKSAVPTIIFHQY